MFLVASIARCQTLGLLRPRLTETVQKIVLPSVCNYHCLNTNHLNNAPTISASKKTSLLQNEEILKISQTISRPLIKYSLRKGKRKTVKPILKRFKRLDWGIWIRTKSGRHKKLWKKSSAQKRRLRQHVFVNATQSTLLDKMVTKYWRRPKYYVDDIYEPYHRREEFYITRRKPL